MEASMDGREGLKNRGYSRDDVEDRRRALEQQTGTVLSNIAAYSFDPLLAQKNIENMIGVIQVPLGFCGPLPIAGDDANGDFYVPLATTEGALLASVNRGCAIIRKSGSVRTSVFHDAMTRAPVMRVRDIAHSRSVIDWIDNNMESLRAEVGKTTSHGRLKDIQCLPNGRNLFLRFSYHTGDAMGMNMATIATESACRLIEKETGAVMVSVSGNVCSDKKPAAINQILGRGKTVLADITIPASVVEGSLHCSVESVVETAERKNLVGSQMAGLLGGNAHAANLLAALDIATGQDPAQVVEGSLCSTLCESVDGDLYISVRLPAVEVGTVGGGTRLPCQSEALSIMDCLGNGKAIKLAEIVAATVLAGELSTLGAQAAGHLGKAHGELGR